MNTEQINWLGMNTVGMYGAISGQLPEMPALDIEALPNPEEPA